MEFSDFCKITKNYPQERLQVFIDHSNLYKALKEQDPNLLLKYDKLAWKLAGGRKLMRINIYVSRLDKTLEPEPARLQEAFLSKIQSIPLVTVNTRPLRYTPDGRRSREKGIDILLATDMLSQAYVNGYDSMLLVSGDGDYAPVLEEIKKMGKRVENAFFKSERSYALRNAADIFIDLDQAVLDGCIMVKKPAPRKSGAG